MGRRRALAVAAIGTLALLGAACGSTDGRSSSEESQALRRGPNIATTIDSAVFTVDCAFTHRAADDPIVHPGDPGASHMHDFFGAVGVDAHSRADDLLGGDTTCEDREDTASYWAPTLYDGTEPIEPIGLRAYYRAAVGADVTEVQRPPTGLELIAGDMHRAAGDWPELAEVSWGCGRRPKTPRPTPPEDCTRRSPLALTLVFADCWNGTDLSAPDHRSHVAYSTGGRCPRAHPVPILQVQVTIEYPVWAADEVGGGVDTDDLMLASGRWEGAHGDFLNAWDPERLRNRTDLCIRSMANCTIG